jgi:hypothetical protein
LRAQRRSPPREQPTSETVTQERVAALRFDGRLLSRQINLALGHLALITRLGKSPLASHCGLLLYTVANETRYRPEAMSSRVAQLAIIDTLVSCCALTDTERSVDRLQHAARILSEKRF